ncbi:MULTISPECIES: hypothetical protein [unclassified Kitasatospora]|uniref:hypothetical protein n=1 Tax=unclassified Kitasatospora TaxID=2633591 RepID=UPI00070ED6CD|nr:MULTISPECIES: hypothetical protein [unclassified Kitasatospora]KQV24089.1 hypothetical protein ASC99_02525 [Kitasatospora sp. Root107]KRB67196.1 hypothetical protein ASE03_02215 [Kitasatospora sp. Root187]
MAKQRFSISLDEEHAAEIRTTAALLGEDVSAFMTKAALEAVRREQRKLEVFREIDSQIAAVEAGTAGTDEAMAGIATDPQVDAVWDDFFRTPGQGAA